jgi:uncharacterized cupin superfamily protein
MCAGFKTGDGTAHHFVTGTASRSDRCRVL